MKHRRPAPCRSLMVACIILQCLPLAQQIATADSPAMSLVAPESLGLGNDELNRIDDEVNTAIQKQQLPGAVVAIGFQGRLVFLRAYGKRQVFPTNEPMTVDTVFDLASLTKPLATACCVMKLVESGALELSDPVAKHLPEFAAHGKQAVTIKQLLLHTSGLIPDNAMADYSSGPVTAIEKVMQLPLNYQPSEKFRYSDVGFIVLGELVRRKSGKDTAEFAAEHFYSLLGLNDTDFRLSAAQRLRTAPTEQRNGTWMTGEVHDPRAFALGGVAGHAGLFSTATDIAVFAQMLLNGGEYNGQRLLNAKSVATMTAAYQVPGGIRSLGWDKQSAYSSNRGSSMSARAYGHGGFTGTGLWIDPDLQLFVVFLSNRLHPDGNGVVNPLIGRIGTIAADAAITALAP